MSQLRGGSEKSLRRVASERRTTHFVVRKILARSRAVSFPIRFDDKTLARQRISCAIQFPTLGKPFCMRSAALIGAFRCRSRNSLKNFWSNSFESISGGRFFHQSGSPLP